MARLCVQQVQYHCVNSILSDAVATYWKHSISMPNRGTDEQMVDSSDSVSLSLPPSLSVVEVEVCDPKIELSFGTHCRTLCVPRPVPLLRG